MLRGRTAKGEQYHWSRSDALNLDLCWEYGHLRWWDPAAREYMPTIQQVWDAERGGAGESETGIAAERARRASTAAHVRELEAELERLQRP